MQLFLEFHLHLYQFVYLFLHHQLQILFDLYDFQEDVLSDFQNERYNIILKARQLGLSTLTGGYSLWLMLFHQDKNVLVIVSGGNIDRELFKDILDEKKTN